MLCQPRQSFDSECKSRRDKNKHVLIARKDKWVEQLIRSQLVLNLNTPRGGMAKSTSAELKHRRKD